MSTQTTGPHISTPVNDDVTITLDNGQLNMLLEALGIAYSTCTQAVPSDRVLIGQPEDYTELSRQIKAQLPGQAPAQQAAPVQEAQ